MKHVLMTTDAVGGVWTYALELARALGAHGIEVTLATMGPLPSRIQLGEAEALENTRLVCSEFALEWMPQPWAEVDAAGEWLLELAAREEPDVIHLNGYAHANLPWPCPILVAAHSCVRTWWRAVFQIDVPAQYQEYHRRVRDGLRAADVVITPTAAFRRELEQAYDLRLPGATIHNARTLEQFHPAPKKKLIMSAGRLWDPAKNISLLEKIAPGLSWPIHIAGPGGTTTAMPRLCSLGNLSTSELQAVLSEAAIYAAPAKYEPFGLSVLEAALSGCALVLADLPTLREVWEGAALYANPNEPGAWQTTLQRVIQDESLRENLQRQACERARLFAPDLCARAYLRHYEPSTQLSLATTSAHSL